MLSAFIQSKRPSCTRKVTTCDACYCKILFAGRRNVPGHIRGRVQDLCGNSLVTSLNCRPAVELHVPEHALIKLVDWVPLPSGGWGVILKTFIIGISFFNFVLGGNECVRGKLQARCFFWLVATSAWLITKVAEWPTDAE